MPGRMTQRGLVTWRAIRHIRASVSARGRRRRCAGGMAVTSAPRCALHATPPCCSRYAAAVKLPLQRRITACVPPFRVQGRGAALARGRWHATDAGEAPTLRLHARGAALALGRWRAHAANADDALKALESAGNPLGTGPVIVGVTPEDAETLDAILSAGAWEDVQQMARRAGKRGGACAAR